MGWGESFPAFMLSPKCIVTLRVGKRRIRPSEVGWVEADVNIAFTLLLQVPARQEIEVGNHGDKA